jgi:hypothetical protein
VVRESFPDLAVRNGPFKGLVYPGTNAVCSAFLPKLLGSYEKELHLALELECSHGFPVVIDVGCAEGFYAVGLARRLPEATVHAFDTDKNARELCLEMAKLNGVADRVVIGGWCGPDELSALARGRRTLIICDCEGYELQLLAPSVIPALAQSDLVVELHDFYGADIFTPLCERFRQSHDIVILTSTDDDAKVQYYRYPEIEKYDRQIRKFILAERRPTIMNWLVLTARHPTQINGTP